MMETINNGKDTSVLYAHIFKLWSVDRLNFKQIAAEKMPSSLSLKRIRNIVYSGRHCAKTDHQREIYSLFRCKFLELQDVRDAIDYVYNNQPGYYVKIRTVRNAVNYILKMSCNHENKICK